MVWSAARNRNWLTEARSRKLKKLSVAVVVLCLLLLPLTLGAACYYSGKRAIVGIGGCALMFGLDPAKAEGFKFTTNVFPLPIPFILSGPTGGFVIVIPLWIPALIAFGSAQVFRRCENKMRAGHCLKCSYNLTGNTSGVCPECGTPGSTSPRN